MGYHYRSRLFFPALATLALLTPAVFALGQTQEAGDKVYEKTVRSTAWVLSVHGLKPGLQGSASLLNRGQRLLITTNHIVHDTDHVRVFFAAFQNMKPVAERSHYLKQLETGGGIPGKVIARDPRRDLALIQLDEVPKGVEEVILACDGVRTGQRVHSVGNPARIDALWVYTPGTVRQVFKKSWTANGANVQFDFEARVVVTESLTNEGDSGGPLVNDRGELVAITQGLDPKARGVSLFIDACEVKDFLKSRNVAFRVGPPISAEGRAQVRPVPPVELSEAEKAASKLSLAKTLAEAGKKDKARERFEEIVKQYPGTDAAREARELLEKLNQK